MIPLLTYPLALIAAVAVPALVAIYFFRTRFQRRPVSSLMLWQRARQPREGGARFRRLVMPLAFFVELAALLLLILAATDPRFAVDLSRKPLLVVLDDSASMLAGRDAATPRSRALAELRALCARPDTGNVRLIIAGRQPVILDPIRPDSALLNNALKQWKCAYPEACLEKALAAAQELSQKRGRIVVLTDHAPPPEIVSERLLWVACGRPLPNVGIVNAARSGGASKDRCLLEIANYSDQPVQAPLTVKFGPGIPDANQVLNLSTGELKRLTFDLPPNAGELCARLPADELAADNEIVLLPQPVRKAAVAVEIADPLLDRTIRKALDATGLALPGGAKPQLVIADRTIPADDDPRRWLLRVDGGSNASSYNGPFVIDTGHPLARGLDLDGVIWGIGISNAAAGFPVISVGNIPVVLDQVFPSGRHELRLRFQPAAATLQETPNWPILFWNLLQWRMDEAEGLAAVNVRAGAEVSLRLDQAVPAVKVRQPDGTTAELKPARRSALIGTSLPGIYQVAAGQAQYALACNFLAPEESDLRAAGSGKWGRLVETEMLKKDYLSFAWLPLLLALGLLAGHLALVRH
jgi:hypothetical protein